MTETINILCFYDAGAAVGSVEGKSVWLMVGPEKVRFFIHGRSLTHYATGLKIGQAGPDGHMVMDLAIAQAMLCQKVDELGSEAILVHMSSKPILASRHWACSPI